MFGMPAMGASGAAWATVLGQILSLVIISAFYFKRGVGIDRGIRYLKPEKSVLKDIYTVGFPAIIMQILTPVMTYVMNLILGTISVSAVTAYGVYYKLQSFIFMPGFGLNNALIPIVSFNYGAGKKERIREAIRWGLVYVSIIMGAGIILFQLGAGAMVGIFSIAEESTRLCITALRIISCGFFFAGGNIIPVSYTHLEVIVFIIGLIVLRRDTLRSSALMGTISIVLAVLLDMVIPFHFG